MRSTQTVPFLGPPSRARGTAPYKLSEAPPVVTFRRLQRSISCLVYITLHYTSSTVLYITDTMMIVSVYNTDGRSRGRVLS